MHAPKGSATTKAATRPPKAVPDAVPPATRPAPSISDEAPPASPRLDPREPDAPSTAPLLPRIDDVDSFPPLAPSSGWSRNRPKVTFAQASAKARHLTQAAAQARGAAKDKAQQVQRAQHSTYTGRPKGGVVRHSPAPNTTELTILRDGGFEDDAQETAFRARHKADIVRELQRPSW